MTNILRETWPFLTEIKYLDKEYVGIVQNADNVYVHMYVLEQNMTLEQKREFLSCGELYWWGSNRLIPINVFLCDRFKPFKKYLKTFSKREVEVVFGPMPSMENLINRKSKKRTVQLIRNEN
jgi:hypothetical protein